ncbi:5-carboxymethyl-2-hydroxymuconate semialdehyde dehydrogenase [soil metagenome]
MSTATTATAPPKDARNRALELARSLPNGVQHLINGELVDSRSSETFDTLSPIDNAVICPVASGGAEDVGLAARAAKDAFAVWHDLPAKERKGLLHSVADLIEKNAEELAILESLDTGQVFKTMRGAVARSAENFRFFADRAESARDGLSLPSEGFLNYTLRQPIGAVGIITPWNTPFMLSTWKMAPALAAGCTVVHKPAEWSPITALRLAQLVLEAGIPPGVVNVVNGYGETAGKALTEHPDIRAIAFVGETVTGSRIMAQGAQTLKRVHFELGGKNPIVVFADADLERALDAAIFGVYSLNGERCTASSRLFVQQEVYGDFTEKLVERVKNIPVGDPFDPATTIGPLIHRQHLDKVMRYVRAGQEEGATLACGGVRPKGLEEGNYLSATLFTDASNAMRIAQEEVFGPFLTVIPFGGEEEALRLANGVKYGLAAYLWTRDLTRAHSFAHGLEAGMVWVNSQNVRHLPTPFGGMKSSGIGRDGGDYSFDFYMETKNIAVALGEHPIPHYGRAPKREDKASVKSSE